MDNFTPLKLGPTKKKSSRLGIFLSFFGLIIIIIGLVGYLTVLKKPIRPQVPAAFQATKVCNGETGERKGVVNVTHKFNSIEECVSCRDGGNCNPAQLVGQPTDCAGGQVCIPGTPASCVIPEGQNSCTFSVTVPDCSVYQIDCGNGEWPNLGGISGAIEFNCSGICGNPPTATPVVTETPSPTPTGEVTPSPTSTETPTPTVTPNPSATPTPNPSATPTPNPSATPTPNPSATPTPNPSATPTEIILAKTSVNPTVATTEIPSVGVTKFGAIFGGISIVIILLGLIF
jgi:hypothetical protein